MPGTTRVRRVFSTRAGGRSTGVYGQFNLSAGVGDDPALVAANRARVRDRLGVPVVYLAQVHGTRVATVTAAPAPDDPDVPDTDAAVTALPGVGLAVLAADCVPILLADPVAGVVGAAHAGRVGAAAGVLPATLAAMTALGARVHAVEVLLGPAICGGCYEVPEAMRAEVDAALPGSAARTRRGTPGSICGPASTTRPTELGVARIGGDPRCTWSPTTCTATAARAALDARPRSTWLDPS